MGTALSSPRDGPPNGINGGSGWGQQLRTSKSTFSLKTDRASLAGGSSANSGHSSGLFRSGLPSSISFRNLSIGQAGFGRRKDKTAAQQQQLAGKQQPQQPQQPHQLLPPSSIATISNWSHDGGAQNPQPHHHHHHGGHLLQPQQQQLQLPAAPCKSQQSRSGLTKSTSCYAIKASAAGAAAASASAGTAAAAAAGATPEGDKENTGRSGASDSRRLLVQASTSDLLKCVAAFLRQHCSELHCDSGSVVSWIRSVDRNLILQGWADMAFVNPPNLVFFYLLVKAAVPADIASERQLQATLLTCLYVAYSYMGNEISYPLKPFLVDGNRAAFWDRCISLANLRSADMLRLNSDPAFFIDVFTELRSYA
ncbi:hypothetical protein BOX15_Mlig029958g3 [Macrostomum lignano]|uniref:Cyclin-dependent kinase 5 activator n=1 Tax=Macrostomum lignano TaxID=282301 RepID=A0A267ECH4_9PLAT|nr:hypothetical protein BOX15_Mlig029958g1 [Macrostomum lignano]PAA80490.1 hypothetical protein BOX15_Mlig029958g3 [Macrostomum lignano]